LDRLTSTLVSLFAGSIPGIVVATLAIVGGRLAF